MSACGVCGKCPCYEHERKTVAMTAKQATHEERMAGSHAQHIDKLLVGWAQAETTSARHDAFQELRAYADSLASELSQERERRECAEADGDHFLYLLSEVMGGSDRAVDEATEVLRKERRRVDRAEEKALAEYDRRDGAGESGGGGGG